jgi:hypothetical protein
VRRQWPFERLGHLAARQPHRSAAPWLGSGEIGLPERLSATTTVTTTSCGLQVGGGLGRLERDSFASGLESLAGHGLVDASGRLTEQGAVLTAPLRDTTASFRCTARAGSRTAAYQAWSGSRGEALVLAGPSLTSDSDDDAPAGAVRPDLLDQAELAHDVASWLGVSPAWGLDVGSSPVERDAVFARIEARTSPPAGAGADLRAVWDEPWLVWTVEHPAGPPPVTYLRAGIHGQYRLVSTAEGVIMEATATRNVHRDLLVRMAPQGLRRWAGLS